MWRENVRNIYLSTKSLELVTDRLCKDAGDRRFCGRRDSTTRDRPAGTHFVDIQAGGSYIDD